MKWSYKMEEKVKKAFKNLSGYTIKATEKAILELDKSILDKKNESVKKQLEQYFAGQRQQFDLPLDFQGTDFQQQVWQALLTIPYGEKRSYKDIAVQIGNEKAVRAVGAANGRNPISIIAPCHRVIGSSGALVGFAGGLDKKQILLSLEQQI